MSTNNQSNSLIKWTVIVTDFVLLNAIILAFLYFVGGEHAWVEKSRIIYLLIQNLALVISESRFYTIVHQRIVSAGDILRRIFGLVALQAFAAVILLKLIISDYTINIHFVMIEVLFLVLMMAKRFVERWFIKLYREAGRNIRSVTLVGSDPELIEVYKRLIKDPTLGYNILGYYGDESLLELFEKEPEAERRHGKKRQEKLERLGSFEEFMAGMNNTDSLTLGDELYVSISRKDKQKIRRISQMCNSRVIRFYYVPVSVETIGISLKKDMLDDMEVYTTFENPLQNPVNRMIKRAFDIVMSLVFLIPTALIFPIIWIIIKIQSPGPVFFRQERTGLDGKNFYCYKFRSMHVNKDADRLQATKDDPRKFPFGNFMRKANIDELPQFWNVLNGDMSIVGPRPHMLAHTEQYSQLIDKYMVRHFVKPGVTGWAQVTGFRGETKELWQMEGRVKRDIWYMENWSIWLDVRIIWMTIKTIFIHDTNAY